MSVFKNSDMAGGRAILSQFGLSESGKINGDDPGRWLQPGPDSAKGRQTLGPWACHQNGQWPIFAGVGEPDADHSGLSRLNTGNEAGRHLAS